MAATGNYITQTDVTQRMTAQLLTEIYDDDGSGSIVTAEEPAITDIILDGENLVEEYLRKTYGPAGFTWLRATGVAVPRSVKRRCLDAVRIYIAERHPGYIRIDTEMAWKRFHEDMTRLRVREIEMAVADGASPEPAVNEGAEVRSGDPDDTDPAAPYFLRGMGVFTLF